MPESTSSPSAESRYTLGAWMRKVWRTVHHGFAVLGWALLAVLLVLGWQTQWRAEALQRVRAWLEQSLYQAGEDTEGALPTLSLQNPQKLPPAQRRVVHWLAQKYKLAPEAMAALVMQAHRLAENSPVPAHLTLAIIAAESSFHPLVQSRAGAQGLMQVMTPVHLERYKAYGGAQAALDPMINMQVGVEVLSEYIRQHNGALMPALRAYLGVSSSTASDGGYVQKVFSEQTRLDRVAAGRAVAESEPVELGAIAGEIQVPVPSQTPETSEMPESSEAPPIK